MPSKKKIETEAVEIQEKYIIPEEEAKKLAPEEVMEVEAPEVKVQEAKKEEKEAKKEDKKTPEDTKKSKQEPKFKVGDLVFIHKDADADLNGFKLFPQYKKYTYTVEAYDADTDVYSLRRLNLSLKLKGELILAPSERAHDALNKKQY